MNRIVGFFLAVWTYVGVLSTAAIALYGLLFLSANPTPWNFPGDPPLFDLLIYGAAFSAIVNIPLALIVSRLGQGRVLSIPRLCSIAAVMMLIGSAAGILERHSPRWRPVRDGIRHYGDLIDAAAGNKRHVLTNEEFDRFHERFMPQPIAVMLPGYGTVHLRMAAGVYPYVSVDFGGGANALFDPQTMICVYSD